MLLIAAAGLVASVVSPGALPVRTAFRDRMGFPLRSEDELRAIARRQVREARGQLVHATARRAG